MDGRGLVGYGPWKANAQDFKALDDYLGQFGPKTKTPARGDEQVAAAINAYNAFAIRWVLENYTTESIHDLPDSFSRNARAVGGE